jgi:hypothetical protein
MDVPQSLLFHSSKGFFVNWNFKLNVRNDGLYPEHKLQWYSWKSDIQFCFNQTLTAFNKLKIISEVTIRLYSFKIQGCSIVNNCITLSLLLHSCMCKTVQQTLFHIAISIKYCPGGHFNIGHYHVLPLPY